MLYFQYVVAKSLAAAAELIITLFGVLPTKLRRPAFQLAMYVLCARQCWWLHSCGLFISCRVLCRRGHALPLCLWLWLCLCPYACLWLHLCLCVHVYRYMSPLCCIILFSLKKEQTERMKFRWRMRQTRGENKLIDAIALLLFSWSWWWHGWNR